MVFKHDMEVSFSFGKNWQVFLKSLNKERFDFAEKSLKEFMKIKNMKGKSFLDIGCGSGLFSYTAHKLGAKNVVSFDVDPFSVQCCKHMYKVANNPKNWIIHDGSILDDKFVSKLGKFDIVYSWGVLHHTGNMWEAIRKSAKLVERGGYYYIALYNKKGGVLGSNMWLIIKKMYNRSSNLGKYLIEAFYMTAYLSAYTVKMKNPFSHIRDYYKTKRGMNFRTDVTDWLGGYPYEFATTEEIYHFMKKEFPDFDLVNMKTVKGLANNWFLFKRRE
ncbi:MAG: class I SAM-dependent methyltransferase [Nanoarchaeota archaeon]